MLNHIEKEKEVCRFVKSLTGVDEKDIKSSGRRADFVEARAIYIYTLRVMGFSYSAIGRFLGKHHTTAIYLFYRFKKSPELLQVHSMILKQFPEDIKETYPQNPQD